ncbi:hypothetical protein CEXT_338401 [Caerostris extrusa]|uniref:Uncharacterized protein n=1 Tax=Caerostris extrusa TaxID=172846 RepID=A0AAV4Y088_CAEEX|nr:hypothetical protein CEXT_338401 [Caerostris extrusa]
MEISLPNDSNSNSSVSSHDSIIIPSKFQKTTGTDNKESVINEKASKSIGKAVLIEPLKMNHRPSKLRGKEEWFEDKSSENISTVPIQEAKKIET